jgi:hypothetical protein
MVGAVVGLIVPAAHAVATPAGDAMIDPGPEWTLVDEQPGAQGSLTRTYQNDRGFLLLNAIPVTTPPGVRAAFELLTNMNGFSAVPEDSLDLAAWVVQDGSELRNATSAQLMFGARDYLFTFSAGTDGSVDPLDLLRDLARRQVTAAGEAPASETETPERTETESELIAMLPAAPPDGYDLLVNSTTAGPDELAPADDVDLQVVDFLNDNATSATRVWAGTVLAGAVSITHYPY